MELYSLKSKVALITGVSRKQGLGAAIALELAQAGADIFTTFYRPYDVTMPWGSNISEAEEILGQLRAWGVRADGLELDLADSCNPSLLFDRVEQSLGPVDILVNNAAYSERDGIDNLDAALLDRHYAINVRATVLLCAEFVRRFIHGIEGRIINLSSGQGVGPMPGELAYAATKGAVEAFTISLSAELASRSITVNAIDPGATDTGWMSPEFKKTLQANAPMGRIGLPTDAARLARFLASAEAGWITGQIIHSRGGM